MNMPEPFGYLEPTGRSPAFHFLKRDNEAGMPVFTADQMRAYGAACAAAEPVQEPVIWIQSNHLQHAKNSPYLARTGPTKLMSDFIPLYAAPQQRQPQQHELLGAIARGWGASINDEKVLDVDLAIAIADEVSKLLGAPQQRQPLSDEQIYAAISDQVFWATSKNFIVRVVRDVEAAHGITGGKE